MCKNDSTATNWTHVHLCHVVICCDYGRNLQNVLDIGQKENNGGIILQLSLVVKQRCISEFKECVSTIGYELTAF